MFEVLAYFIGFRIYLWQRKRSQAPTPPTIESQQTPEQGIEGLAILAGALFGAACGAYLLGTLEHLPHSLGIAHSPYLDHIDPHHDHNPEISLFGIEHLVIGKTIVGGLLGGWIGVEIAKRLLRIKHSTGDVTVLPLIIGMAIGRIGCFMTGLEDATHGVHTDMPWAIDFGDGPRHPTQAYDIIFLSSLALALSFSGRLRFVASRSGALFRLFMLSYTLWRFSIDFLKPTPPLVWELTAIQCACLIAAIICVISLIRLKPTPAPNHPEADHD